MIEMHRVSKWYDKRQVPTDCSTKVNKGGVENCPKDAFFGDLAARSERTRHFLSKPLAH